MIKKIVAAIAAGFICASPVQAKTTIDTSPVVQLVCEDRSGTAVKIDDDTYITAAHVAVGENCKVGGTAIVLTEIDTTRDFAVFTGPASRISAKYTCRGFSSDEEYLAVGHAFGWKELTYQPVRASGFGVRGEPTQMFTGEVIPGMSGGPVYGKNGRVVGIVNMRWPARSLPLSETSVCKRN